MSKENKSITINSELTTKSTASLNREVYDEDLKQQDRCIADLIKNCASRKENK